eukprot:11982162-Prorocentrum_lima.AAC.1
MTSSLVGSEMCIRDSTPYSSSTARRWRAWLAFRCLARRPAFDCNSVSSAVSYTHLTLPTICSV